MEKPRSRRRKISKELSESSESDHEELCTDEDEIIDNPQKRLLCVLCKLNGERAVTGRLIPFHIN
jgi:hypothetical protein